MSTSLNKLLTATYKLCVKHFHKQQLHTATAQSNNNLSKQATQRGLLWRDIKPIIKKKRLISHFIVR